MATEKHILLSIGSNLGDRKQNIEDAITMLRDCGLINDLKISELYETEPFGNKELPAFLNNVVSFKTSLSAKEVFGLCKIIESNIGRVERGRWQSREIDLDILLYDSDIIEDRELQIPHPQMHLRNFVLIPACDLAPFTIHPIFNKTIQQLLTECNDTCSVELFKKK